MRIVVALGGNALLRRHERAEAGVQRANVAVAVGAMLELARDHELVITHGNGPQVGLLALQAEAYRDVAAYPLDILGAESEGMVGYLLDQELVSQMPGRDVATLLTQVVVDAADRAFAHPTKPIGPMYDAATASRLAGERGWVTGPDGDGWRRLVPSPEPKRILEARTISLLVDAGVLVVCAGGGGIPVSVEDGCVHGVEAVIDKDLSAALLAESVGADALMLLTDVDAVYRHWGTESAGAVAAASPEAMRRLRLASGSMGPKAEAAARFAERGGVAFIGALADASRLLGGGAGTRVAGDVVGLELREERGSHVGYATA